jgi:hypothetical protein
MAKENGAQDEQEETDIGLGWNSTATGCGINEGPSDPGLAHHLPASGWQIRGCANSLDSAWRIWRAAAD